MGDQSIEERIAASVDALYLALKHNQKFKDEPAWQVVLAAVPTITSHYLKGQ